MYKEQVVERIEKDQNESLERSVNLINFWEHQVKKKRKASIIKNGNEIHLRCYRNKIVYNQNKTKYFTPKKKKKTSIMGMNS